MTIDDYVIGKEQKDTFCYIIEQDLDRLGKILGSTASKKFGIYYNKGKGKYISLPKYGKNNKEAFETIRKAILELLDAGKQGNMAALESNILSPMFKGKILSVYFPDDYLNVFSDDHLIHYLKVFNLDTKDLIKKDPLFKREALLTFKNSIPEMRSWSPDIFGHFLYANFSPKNKDERHAQNDEDDEFPTIDSYSFVDLDIDPTEKTISSKGGKIAPKVNYEKESRRYRKYGDRGEKIVMMAEIERVMNELNLTRKKAEKEVVQMSMKSDSYGYDILSVNPDGSSRYIEVKATTGKVGDVEFYYTENELEKAKELKKNYFIYIVFEIKTKNPKIWVVQNPFLAKKVTKRPVQYKVSIKTK